jgi:hypothetical protein
MNCPAPVFAALHWRAKVANQNCCSIKGTKMLLRLEHTARAIHPAPASAFPNADLSNLDRTSMAELEFE